jgi:hypothetical protein
MKKFLTALVALLVPAIAFANGWRYSGENISLAATTTSQNIQFTLNASLTAPQLLVYNAATAPAVVNCGATSSVTAAQPGSGTNGGVVIPPGVQYELFKGSSAYCAAILTTGTGTVYFSPGVDDSD